jgi:hypothetical protein
LPAVTILILLLIFQGLAPDLQAQSMPPVPTPQQLDQLLAPVALYPDSLLAQITTASTNPQEILDVDNWLAQNQNLSVSQQIEAAQQQGFDPAFIALISFPQVIQMMAENIDDYASIGAAVLSNQNEVSASIQRLRAQAYNSGALRSTPQQTVEAQDYSGQVVYVINPVNPQVVYLPQYDPTVVYRPGASAGLITFGLAIGITALLVSQPWGWGGWGWNWRARQIYYNRGPWGGWRGGYRPPHYYYRPRPIAWNQRPGYGGNWGYRPPNYRPPRPVNRPGFRPGNQRPISGPGNRPNTGFRPANPSRPNGGYNRPPSSNRPPNGGRPGMPISRPQPGPPQNRPQPSRPGPGQGRPTNRPAGPPQNRPTAGPSRPVGPPNRTAPQNRPANGGRPR